MVAGQGDFHDIANSEAAFLGFVRHNLLAGATDGQNAGLRRVDNSSEVLNAIHAQVGNAEAAALVFVRSELAVASASSHVLDLVGNIRQAAAFSVCNNRSNQAVGSGDSDRDISRVIPITRSLVLQN